MGTETANELGNSSSVGSIEPALRKGSQKSTLLP